MEEFIKFIPEQVKGIENVSEVYIYRDKVVFKTQSSEKTLHYRKTAKYRKIPWWINLRKKLGFYGSYGVVAYRDWPQQNYHFFNGKKAIKIQLSKSVIEDEYIKTLFFRIQQIIR